MSRPDVPMVGNKRSFLAAAVVVWSFVLSGVARAQEAGPGDAPSEPGAAETPSEVPPTPPASAPNDAAAPGRGVPADARLPELLQAIEPEYPPEAAAARLEASVVLRVSIDAEGNVTEAEVTEPAGHGFDEAARAAALRARYRPARRGETNVASRVLVRVEFRLPQAPLTGSQSVPISARLEPSATEAAIDVTVREEKRPAALPVDVVTRNDVRRSNANNAADALQRLPGITTEGPHNQRDRNHFVSMRGLPPDYTLVLVDGQRTATEGRGRANLSNLPAESIDRIEIVRGPQAVIFGADAIGGVVNVVTRPAAASDRLLLEAGCGDFDTCRGVALGQLAGRPGSIRLSARVEDSDGWTDAWDLDRTRRQAFAHSDARPTRKILLGAGGTLLLPGDKALTLDLRGNFESRDQTRTTGSYSKEGFRSGEEERFDGQVILGWYAAPTKTLATRAAVSAARLRKRKREVEGALLRSAGRDVGSVLLARQEDVVDDVISAQLRADWAADHDTTVIALLEGRRQARSSDDFERRQSYDIEGYLVGDASFSEPEKMFDKSETVVAAAAQLERHLGTLITVTVGGRGEWNETWGGFFSPAGSAAWHIVPRLSLQYAIGRGYKMPAFDSQTRSATPVFDSLSGVWFAGNPDLAPESSISQEVGVRLRPERPTRDSAGVRPFAGITAFRVDFKDRILKAQELNWEGTGYPLEREINVGNVTSSGVELSAGLEFSHRAYASVNATYLRARNEDIDQRLDGTPDWTLNLLAGGTLPVVQTQIATTLRYVSEQPRFTVDGRERDDSPVEAQILLDANVRQPIAWGLSAWVELRNLLDLSWDRDNDGDTDMPPFHLFAGLTLDLEEENRTKGAQ